MLLAGLRRRPLSKVVVEGPSMLPELAPGDHLLVLGWGGLRPDDLVVVDDPSGAGMLVKRVVAVDAGGAVEVRGDNEALSVDSRRFGPVPRGSVRGRPVFRYAPASAVGWLPRGRRYHGAP